MKIGEYKATDFGQKTIASDKRVDKSKNEEVSDASSFGATNSALLAKNAAFVSDIKAINETMIGIGMAENSIQKINGEKMEESVRDLRNITATLKDMLSKSFAANNESGADYSVEAFKTKLYGTNPSNLHNFDYLATKATSLLA